MQSSISHTRAGKQEKGRATPLVIGISFRNSSIAHRERLAARLDEKRLADSEGATELVVLKTCSRIEAILSSTKPSETTKSILEMWEKELDGTRCYVKEGRGAISHIFRVALGLDSIVQGEDQILQQLREATRNARRAGTSGKVLTPLLDAALNAGKRVRSANGNKAMSLSALGLQLALERHGSRPGSVLLIGTGSTARIAAEQLHASELSIATRRESIGGSFPKARLIPWRDLKKVAARSDLIISASNHDGYVLRRDDIPDNRKRTILDLSFPRNIDPSFREHRNTRLIDLDDLAHYDVANVVGVSARAQELLGEEVESFELWLNASKLDPTLSEIFRRFEAIREKEIGSAMARLDGLTPREKRIVETMGRRIVNKLLAGPARYAKASIGEQSQQERLDILRAIFVEEAE